jgi:pimeloyl-ACP methyl ester carboxylesterase
MKIQKLLYLLLLLLFFSCSKDSEDPSPQPEVTNQFLSSSELILSQTKSNLSGLVQLAETAYPGVSNLLPYLEYDIDVYTITYKTTYLGEEITASGLVTFPKTTEPIPMMSFQHGTMVSHAEAPTEDVNTYGFLSTLASAGYIFLIPDFIGFGASKDKLHPYYIEELTASSVIDMMHAAKELAVEKGYNFDERVFLSGYSEGGYATMATHKSLEQNPIAGFELIVSAPSSGGYNLKSMQEYFFSLETYHNPFYLGYVAMSFQSQGVENVSSLIFQEPYASKMPQLFDGSLTGGQINAQLTDVVADLVQADFLINVDTNSAYAEILTNFEKNSVDNWTPTKRMMLYHGDADITVPYHTSQETFDKMLAGGTSSSVLTFTPLVGKTHLTGFIPYLTEMVKDFDPLK